MKLWTIWNPFFYVVCSAQSVKQSFVYSAVLDDKVLKWFNNKSKNKKCNSEVILFKTNRQHILSRGKT